jgi:hypothetical protein
MSEIGGGEDLKDRASPFVNRDEKEELDSVLRMINDKANNISKFQHQP